MIVSVANGKRLPNQPSLGPAIVDQMALFNAGERASLIVLRGGQTIKVNVRLGSMIDSSALGAMPPANDYTVVTI